MIISRRSLLRTLLLSPLALTVDVERLIWVPKQMIVVPGFKKGPIDYAAIVAAEWEKVVLSGKLVDLFERDDTFFKTISGKFSEHEKRYYKEIALRVGNK